MDQAPLPKFGGSHQPTHALGPQKTQIISEALSNSFKGLQMNGNCKNHHYTLCGLQELPPGQTTLPCPVTSAAVSSHHAGFLVLLSPPPTDGLFQPHLCEDQCCCLLIQTVLISTSCVKPYPLSLWCHCLCNKSDRAEHAML